MKIRSFQAVRPVRDKVHLVASRSYTIYTKKELREKLTHNPYSFLHIIQPHSGHRKSSAKKSLLRFQQVRKKYEEFLDTHILQRDIQPMFYLYRQLKGDHIFTGLIGAVSVEDYDKGNIRIHEHTLSQREAIFTQYLAITGINAEPVLLMSEKSLHLEKIFAEYTSLRPEYDFTDTGRIHHQLWCIDQPKDISAIEQIFEKMPALYIADGHHRSASSAALRKMYIENGINHSPAHPSNYFLACIIDETNVEVYPFHRMVKDLNGLDARSFLEKLSELFLIRDAPPYFHPQQKGEFSLYLDRQWYCLNLKQSSPLLDSQLLSDWVLAPILGIHDLRQDKRVIFLDGEKGMEGLKYTVDKENFSVGFGLFPVAVSTIKSIADQQKNMPPKSTWIEPKLRSGLIVYELK